MQRIVLLLTSIALILSACVQRPPLVDLGDPICVSGGDGRPVFQLSYNLHRMTPAGPIPRACEVITFACENNRVTERERELQSTPCTT